MIRQLPECMVQLSQFTFLALMAWSLGCKPSESTPPASDGNSTAARLQSSTSTAATVRRHTRPEQTVTAFLEALKMGDELRATSLLTGQAQQEMERANAAIKPPGSPTAEFKVTEVEFLGEAQDGAHVLSSWTDTDLDGVRQSYDIVWILRQENGGWAIAGMATKVFEDQQPLILNFEDPLEAQQKRESVDQEIARRRQPPPSAEQPPVGQPLVGQPLVGQPLVGQPPVGQPPVGQPLVGQPLVGQPLVGQPPVGQPPVGQPPVEQPPVEQPLVGQARRPESSGAPMQR